MSDFVGMLLQAKIDPDALKNIQKDIEKISKNAQAIKLNIDVDDKVLKDIENINKKIGLAVNKSSNKIKIDGDFDKLKVHIDSANKIKKIIMDTTVKYGEQLRTIDKLNNKTGELELTEKILTTNKEKQSKAENKVQEAIAQTIQLREEAGRKAEEQQSKYINKALENNYKLQQQEEEKIQKLREQIELFKKQQEIKVKNLEGKYKSIYDKDAIAEYRQELQKLNTDTPNATHEMKRMALGLKDIEAGAKNSKKSLDLANKSSMSFGEALKTAAYKFGIVMPPNIAIY